jgi:predicted homoserine dehydrogenase-like protein
VLGRIGEYDYRGWAMSWEEARRTGALPIGLAEKAKVVRPIGVGEYLTSANCVPDAALSITQIRQRLDQSDAQFLAA